jgi:apolipoprotein N-acyltransferase
MNEIEDSIIQLSSSKKIGWVCAILTGVMTFMAFPTDLSPQISLWWLIWFSHIPILWWLKDKSPQSGFKWGYLTGIIINTGGYYWIAELIQTFGHLPIYIALLGLALHSLLVGLIWGVWGALVCAFSPRWGRLVTVPVAMMAAEYILPRIFDAHMGDSQYPFVMIMQVADLLGVTAVTGLIYLVNAALTDAIDRDYRGLKIALIFLVCTLGYGALRMNQIDSEMMKAPKLKIGLIEGDVGIFESESRQKKQDHLLIQQRMSADLEAKGAELIIWPESSYRASGIPADLKRFMPSDIPLVAHHEEDIANRTSRRDQITPQRGFRTPLLFGGNGMGRAEPTIEEKKHNKKGRRLYYNRAWLLDEEGTVLGFYDKVHRLVFGEYIPFGDIFPILYKWLPAASRTEAGPGVKSIEFTAKPDLTVRLGMLNCYEGIIPSFTRSLLKTNPHLLINLTNDDWFAATAERYLHFALALPRAIESRRMYLRATLTGVSAIVDANGRILDWTSTEEPETLLREIPLLEGKTVYSVIGDVLPIASLSLMILGLWHRRKTPDEDMIETETSEPMSS